MHNNIIHVNHYFKVYRKILLYQDRTEMAKSYDFRAEVQTNEAAQPYMHATDAC